MSRLEGGKAYGSDLGPYKTPAREDDPRLMSPNFYYDQEDQPIPYKEVVSWGFGDFVFGQGFDNVSSTIKIRQAGFEECLDSEAMFAGLFERLRKMRSLPSTMCGT